jgi:hypothetical protein
MVEGQDCLVFATRDLKVDFFFIVAAYCANCSSRFADRCRWGRKIKQEPYIPQIHLPRDMQPEERIVYLACSEFEKAMLGDGRHAGWVFGHWARDSSAAANSGSASISRLSR